MRENHIRLDIFDVLGVISYKAKHEVGKHSKATIRVIIDEKEKKTILKLPKIQDG